MAIYPKLGEIHIGEPDANAEYFAAKRGDRDPLFLSAFLMPPNLPMKELLSGEKFLFLGQKGTGKTATLRYIEQEAKQLGEAEFLIFKRTFMEEVDLQNFANVPLFVDEQDIQKFKHYHHALKRVFICILISMALRGEEPLDEKDLSEERKGFFAKIKSSTISDVVKLAFDSLSTLAGSLGVDLGKLTDNQALIDLSRAIKRHNDDLLKYLCRVLKKSQRPVRLIIDEIHFAYRTEEGLQQDAILVRDCILCVHSLNDRFAEEKLDCIVYAAVRSEYLEHPIISTADVNHSIESIGVNINWSTYALDANHPLFDMLFERFKSATNESLKRTDFMNAYFANINPQEFLSRTWNKPRDFIRFFKCAKELFPKKTTLSDSDVNAVWRRYAEAAWNEMKSSASPFLTPEALLLFESILRKNMPDFFDNKTLTVDAFSEIIKPVYAKAKGNNTNFYDFEHFMNLLFILGLFGTRHKSDRHETIYQTYHRGNRSFHPQGEIQIHPTVMKAFG